jgi:hypothetical protein
VALLGHPMTAGRPDAWAAFSGALEWSAEARRLHAKADDWARIDLSQSSGFRKAALRAERNADEWRTYPIIPSDVPRPDQPRTERKSERGPSWPIDRETTTI